MSSERVDDPQVRVTDSANRTALSDEVTDGTCSPTNHPMNLPTSGTAELVVGFTADAPATHSPSLRQPQFLHYSSIVFDVASHGRELLMPLLFGFVGAASGSWFWGVIAVAAFAFSFLRTLIRYFTLRYQLVDGELILNEGLIFQNQRIVPLAKIQNIDLMQNVLHRIFRVAEVRLETASGSEAEAVLRVLTDSQITELRQAVSLSRQTKNSIELNRAVSLPGAAASSNPSDPTQFSLPDTSNSIVGTIAEEQSVMPVLSIPLLWLFIAGLAGNRGWLMVGVALGTAYQFDLHERILPQQWEAWLPVFAWNWDDLWNNWLSFVSLGAVAFAVLKVLGVAWYVYRFAGYQLVRQGNDLRVTAGLVNRYSMSVLRPRIQFISIHRPWVLGWFRFVAIRIETAGGAGGGEESSENLSRTWFIPVVPAREVPRLLNEIRPGLLLQEDQLNWRTTSEQTRARLLRMALMISIVVMAICVFWWRYWGLLPGAAFAGHQIWYAIRRSRSQRYARTNFGIVFRSGILYRKLSCTFFDRIQTLRLSQTPFDRSWNMATLAVDTAAAGPADHKIDIPYLDAEFARQEFKSLERAAAEHRPQWRQ
ncbi:MAG: PH domain-containing protein [Planctomycetaceae bacterium]|nr:PH domain-containing protein [Planctomycetaceae bacterium]